MFAIKKPISVGLLALTLSLVNVARTQADEEVYAKVAPATSLILRPDGGYGTGWLVDAKERLIVTAQHVVAGDVTEVAVVFAESRDGEIITDSSYYEQNMQKLALRGKVVYQNVHRDMAVIQVDRLPEGIQSLKLAAKKPRAGEAVHVVGNSTRRLGAMFSYCQGHVRGSFKELNAWPNPAGPNRVVHHTPTNKGDSGGPVVNNRGEVVGFISNGTIGVDMPVGDPFHGVQVTDISTCVTEIHAGLRDYRLKLAK